MKIQSITLHHVSMPLVSPFETSFGRETVRECIIVILQAEGLAGYGECVASRQPGYNYETTLLLLLVGVFSVLKKFHGDLVTIVIIWFVLPAVAIILMRVNLYNNFRQVFFLLPPLFLTAGLGLDWMLTLIRRPAARFLFLFSIILPGVYANITLYPYQYVYYNLLVGGVSGAYRVFELDYWNLAFKEAQSYINQTAGANANIFMGDSKPSAQTFARSDLIFNALGARKRNWENYNYIIVSTAKNSDEKFAEFPTVFVVERDGVP